MKEVTQDRIRRARIAVQRHIHRVTDHDSQVIQSAAEYGIKSLAGVATQDDMKRFELECDFIEQPRDELSLRMSLTRWRHNLDRFHRRSDRVEEIQRSHGISGLVPLLVRLGDDTLPTVWQDDDLSLIESDLEILSQHKERVFAFWLRYGMMNKLDFYERRKVGDRSYWHPVDSVQSLHISTFFYQWAHIGFESCHFISPSMMKRQGYDTQRSQPVYPDDKKHWEVSLTLGNGLYVDDPDDHLWLMACNEHPDN